MTHATGFNWMRERLGRWESRGNNDVAPSVRSCARRSQQHCLLLRRQGFLQRKPSALTLAQARGGAIIGCLHCFPLTEQVMRQAGLQLVPDAVQAQNRPAIFQLRVPEFVIGPVKNRLGNKPGGGTDGNGVRHRAWRRDCPGIPAPVRSPAPIPARGSEPPASPADGPERTST
jgi:hypothetical protein